MLCTRIGNVQMTIVQYNRKNINLDKIMYKTMENALKLYYNTTFSAYKNQIKNNIHYKNQNSYLLNIKIGIAQILHNYIYKHNLL